MTRLHLSRRSSAIILAAVISVAAYMLAAGMMGETGFPLDDAWIHQTYARNLAQTGIWAFVPGEPSAGSTSPLYTLLLTIGYLLRVPFLWWTILLGVLALAGAGLIALRLAERLAPDVPNIGLWAGLAVVTAWHMVWAAASGMETMLFAALTLGMIRLSWRELDQQTQSAQAQVRRGAVLGMVGAAAMLARPEGVGLLGLIGLLMWIARPQGSWRGVWSWSAGVALGWLLGFVPYVLLNVGLGGSILPGTASAKQAEYAALLALPYLRRLSLLVTPLLAGGQIALIPGAGVMLGVVWQKMGKQRALVLLLAPAFWAAALIALYAARLPAAYQHGRYVMPALPHLITLGVAGTGWLVRYGIRRGIGLRVSSRVLMLTAVILFAGFWLLGAQQYGRDVQIIQSEMVVASRWLVAHVPDDDLLAVHDIGAVGYYAPRKILDLAGLVSPEVVPIIRDTDSLWALMASRRAAYIMGFPDQIPPLADEQTVALCPAFISDGTWAQQAGGENMAVYRIAWDGVCP